MKITITPYTKFDGIPTFRDSYITGLYDKMVDEGTARWSLFFECGKHDSKKWLSDMQAKGTFLFVAHDYDLSPLMIAWINHVEYRRAQVHFCGFKKAWGTKTIEIAHMLIDHIMGLKFHNSDEYCIDCLFGIIPKSNKLAVRFAYLCGEFSFTELPNYIWNAENGRSETGIMYCHTRRKL